MGMAHPSTSGPLMATENFDSFPQSHLSIPLRNHSPYIPGEQPKAQNQVVKLNTNENPYPPSSLIRNRVLNEIDKLNLYPNPKSTQLREAIARRHGLSSDQVIVGNGSDDLLNLCVRCFADSKKEIAMLDPSYSLYEVLASIQGANLIGVPFSSDDFAFPLEQVLNLSANLFFLTNPHAPSGLNYDNFLIEEVLDASEGIVVVDEAYADFAQQNAIGLLGKYPNLIITRTFSKSYSLAGLRVGYAMGDPSVIHILDQAREVYNVDRIAQVAAIAALEDQKYFEETKNKIIKGRTQMKSLLDSWGWNTIPSSANFLFCQPIDSHGNTSAKTAHALYEFLNHQGILIRYFPNNKRTESFVRISIGMPEEMSMLVSTIEKWQLQEKQK